MKAIELDNIHVKLGETQVLKEVTVSIEKGEFLGIIGPNGGGKTTLLKVILGIIEPDEGEVKIFGKPPNENGGLIGYVPQYSNFDLQFPMTVKDVVMMGRVGKLGWNPFYSKEDEKIAQKSLEEVDMLNQQNKQISELSGGQHQRMLLARALATNPEILVLDEPTASVDEKRKNNIYELLKKFNEKLEKTIIIATHDIGIISSHVKSIACLNRYLVFHGEDEITPGVIEETYGCPVDLIAHGQPHRVFEKKMPLEEEEQDA